MGRKLTAAFLAAAVVFTATTPALAQSGSLYVGSGPTASKPQSKLWHHDGTWWAVLLDGSDHYIHRLDGNSFIKLADGFVDATNTLFADALWTGEYLFVLMGGSSESRLYKFTYDGTTRSYTKLNGFSVSLPLGAGYESVTIAQDSTGKLWVTTVDGGAVKVLWSTSSDHTSWNTSGVVLDSDVDPDDISAIIAFDGKVGVLWSDQHADMFGFRTHTDGTPESQWSTTEVLAQGGGIADDHINLASTPDGKVLAATKDGRDDVNLFVRNPATGWAGPHVAFETVTRPNILFDDARSRVVVLCTDITVSSYRILWREADLSDLANFALAPSDVLITGPGTGVNDVTSTKQMVDHGTGLLAAAKERAGSYVHFNTIDLSGGVGIPTVTVSASATEGVAPLSVRFTSAANDTNGTIVSYAWNFGDGGTSTQAHPAHTFTTAGFYDVTLTVTDNDGNTRSANVGILVRTAGELVPGDILARVNFQPAGAATPSGYLADAGATFSDTLGYGWNKSVATREYNVHPDQRLDTLVEVNNGGAAANWDYAIANGDYFVTVVAGDPMWSGIHTVAVEGKIVIDGVATTKTFVEAVDKPAMVTDGKLTVSLGGAGSKKSKICYLIIREAVALTGGGEPPPPPPPPPEPSAPTATATATPLSGTAPLVVNFTGGGSDPDGWVASYSWDFGDGTASAVQSPSHTYTTPGSFLAVLTVTDNSGLTSQASVTIEVSAPPGTPGGNTVRINFQPAGAEVPVDYVADSGATFDAARGFGWSRTVETAEKNAIADQRLDTHVFVYNSVKAAVWEHVVPNGDYLVTLVAGDPSNSGVHTVVLEGTTVLSGVSTSSSFVEVKDRRITVSDGRLTMAIGGTGDSKKTKICYVIIAPAQ